VLTSLLVTLTLFGLALLLGATAYESVVMAPNYEANIPTSIDLARRFLSRTTPAAYFRVLAPTTLTLLVISLVACWSNPQARWGMLGGTLALGIADLITLTFHYPRLTVLFRTPFPLEASALRRAAREWAAGNLVRAVLLAAAFFSVIHALRALALG
jgi:hypothetical protein